MLTDFSQLLLTTEISYVVLELFYVDRQKQWH
jgi:hypothetical protein